MSNNTVDRRSSIIEILNEKGKIHVTEVTKIFKVSDVTVRNDLKRLEKDGFLKRIHGGALKTDKVAFDLNLLEKEEKYFDFFQRAVAVYPSICSFYGFALGWLGDFEKGEVFCEKGLNIAVQIGELRTLALSEFYYGWFYCGKGDGKLVVEHFKNSIKY